MQINRLLEIVYILLRHRSITARELAERFNVSTRTIYRDVDNLSLSGIPVYTEKGKNGGISLLPDFVLNKTILNEKEQTEILSALHGLSAVNGAETEHVLQKLSAIFKRSAVSWLEVDFSGWSYTDGSIFNGLKIAILEKRIVEFDYYNTEGEMNSRQVEPLQLWFKSKAWYMKGYCLYRQDIRLFKICRIRRMNVTEKIFPERDLLAVRKINAGVPEPVCRDITLVFKIAPERTYRVLDEFGEEAVKQPDGSFLVTKRWPEDDWVYGFILSFGEYIEVLEPEHIKLTIKEKAKKIMEMYL